MLEVQVQDTSTPLGTDHRGCHKLLLILIELGKIVFKPKRLSQGCGFKGKKERQSYDQ